MNEDDASTSTQNRSGRCRGALTSTATAIYYSYTDREYREYLESPSTSSTVQITDVYETPKRRSSSSVEIEIDDGDDDTY